MVTRARAQSSKLTEKIYDLGGTPIEFPVIKIEDLSNDPTICEEIMKVANYNYLIFTSQNGVKLFFDRMLSLGLDTRQLAKAKIVAIGKVTAQEIKRYHLNADIVPEKYIAEGIYEELVNRLTPEDQVLIPRAKESRDFLVEELRKLCMVKELKIYETVLGDGMSTKEDIKLLLHNNHIDYITFTSSSTVKNLVKIIEGPEMLKDQKLISIGPITSNTITDFGLTVYGEAKDYDIDGLVKVLIDMEYQND